MVAWDIDGLLQRFDQRADCSSTAKLSAFLGETITLDVLIHALRGKGQKVERLPGVPTRRQTRSTLLLWPQAASTRSHSARRGAQDLDTWMWLDGKQLMATECKHWSSCSRGFVTVGNVEAAALRAWELLQEHLGQDVWTETNKISIPLCPPVDPPWGTDEHAAAKIMRSPRRMLAIWAPISEDGVSFFSRTTTPGDIAGMPVQVRIEVFSVSLYLRHLQGHGITRLPSGLPDIDDTLAAIDAMTIR